MPIVRFCIGVVVALLGCALPMGLIELVGQTNDFAFLWLTPLVLTAGVALLAGGSRLAR